MPTIDYTRFQAKVSSLLMRYGQEMTLTRTTLIEGSYGNPGTATSTDYSVNGIVKNLLYSFKDGTLIRLKSADSSSSMVIIEAKDGVPEPQEGDTITIGSTAFNIIDVVPKDPAGTPLAYFFSIRK